MKTERLSFSDAPAQIGEGTYDCLWVRLSPRDTPTQFASPALQWLDWQLQGKLAHFIGNEEWPKQTTFLPTVRQLSVPYVAIDGPKSADWDAFLNNCRGLKLKHVLYFVEDASRVIEFERELKAHKAEQFPTLVTFGSDSTGSS